MADSTDTNRHVSQHYPAPALVSSNENIVLPGPASELLWLDNNIMEILLLRHLALWPVYIVSSKPPPPPHSQYLQSAAWWQCYDVWSPDSHVRPNVGGGDSSTEQWFLLGSSTVIGTALRTAAQHHASPPAQQTYRGCLISIYQLSSAVSAACRSAGKIVAVQMLNVEAWNIPCSDPELHRLPQSSLNCRQQTLVQQPGASNQGPACCMKRREIQTLFIIPLTNSGPLVQKYWSGAGCWVLGA